MKNKNIALLIDCENTSREAVEPVLNELAKYGVVNIRRAYGDWKSSQLKNWESHSLLFALKPVQQFGYTKGKNATDAAIIIDAMDILYTNEVDSFALMSSDSDFTPLVVRLLESGKEVFGFGQKKTPSPFVKACSQFIFTEDLISAAREPEEEPAAEPAPARPAAETASKPAQAQKTKNELRGDTGLVRVLRLACENSAGDDGWSHMSEVTQYIKNQKSYSPVNYGYKSWSKLIQATDLFEGDLRNGTAMYIRDKRKKAAIAKK
ncbi:MAG TPA: NYN domain-containing protein [Kiritimatiellia bacterium]|nr:NYN domain-containing protein [Kiritimatiellia bacterium]HPS09508.1 NYN domain-containing protein [Kiritimatiellia bacterium]